MRRGRTSHQSSTHSWPRYLLSWVVSFTLLPLNPHGKNSRYSMGSRTGLDVETRRWISAPFANPTQQNHCSWSSVVSGTVCFQSRCLLSCARSFYTKL